MRNIYMPSKDVLIEMQDRGANVYKYILTKTIESIIRCGIIYPDAGKLKYAKKYLRENPEIARAICTLYPEEMRYSEVARDDFKLCLRLMRSTPNKESKLNNLAKFNPEVQKDISVIVPVILQLETELKENPRTRFELREYDWYPYQQKYSLLDTILNGKLSDEELHKLKDAGVRDMTVNSLVNIEPAYAISLPYYYFAEKFQDYKEIIRDEYLHKGIDAYANRYGITPSVGTEYIGEDIIRKPNEDVKRLIKCIQDKKDR